MVVAFLVAGLEDRGLKGRLVDDRGEGVRQRPAERNLQMSGRPKMGVWVEMGGRG